METHPFYFLSQSFSYPEKDNMKDAGKALASLAADLGIQKITPQLLCTPVFQDMQAEYVRLFINAYGGMGAPPYASIYIQDMGILRQQGFDEAIGYYQEAGLEPIEIQESADHIAHELFFIGFLLESEQNKLLRRFLKEHLLIWYPNFLLRVEQAVPIPFYSVLCQVTNLCLKQLKKEVVNEQTSFS